MVLLFRLETELQASRAVTGFLTLFLLIGIGVNLYFLIKRRPGKLWTGIRSFFLLVMLGLLYPVIHRCMIDHAMLTNGKTVIGRTEGDCQVPLRGQGIRFSYGTKEATYSNCNSYHPVPRDSIPVPGGKFKVLYAPSYPEYGRMNFREPAPSE